MRLFLGLELPSQIKARLASYISELPHGRKGWENPHDFHLTLLFIGQTPEEKIEEIKERMKLIQFSPFQMAIGPLQFFPRRVLYLSLMPSPELQDLQMQLVKLFPEFVDPNGKKFLPHITVKRWQRYEHHELHQAIEQKPLIPINVDVSELSLFKSEKDSENRKYHVIFKVPARP